MFPLLQFMSLILSILSHNPISFKFLQFESLVFNFSNFNVKVTHHHCTHQHHINTTSTPHTKKELMHEHGLIIKDQLKSQTWVGTNVCSTCC